MTALTRFLFRPPTTHVSVRDTIEWWESRRLAYNVIVGSAGLVTLGWGATLAALTVGLHGVHPFPWQLPVAYGVMANVCYTLGWGAELALQRIVGDDAQQAGAAIFRYGLVFSVGLTLFPAFLMTLAAIGRALFA